MAEVSETPGADDAVSEGAATFRVLCHELRQPLGVAIGYVSMLDDGAFGELPEEVHAIVTTIATRLDALNELIERALAGAQPEADAPG